MVLAALVLEVEGEATPKGAQGFLREAFPQVHDQGENPFSLALGKGWVRFSFLREEVYARLSPTLFGLQGQRVRMGGASGEVRVLRVLQEGHPWAGVSTYARLFQGEGQDLALRFARPSYFRKNGVNYPLPEPRLVFSSLIRRFNAFSPVALPEEVAEAILSRTRLRDFYGRVLPATAEGAGGFVGLAAYRLEGAGEVARYFQALGRFAFYSGVGEGTDLGAGLAKIWAKGEEPRGPTPGSRP